MKFFAKSKGADAAPKNASHVAANAMISTPEKASELLQALQTSLESLPERGPRGRLIRRQIEQVEIACERYRLQAERRRVAEAVERDKTVAQEALTKATTEHARATTLHAAHKAKLDAANDRLAPLERDLHQALTDSEHRAQAAQHAFDEAIANGDKDAEATAAEALFAAKKAIGGNDPIAGSLTLRIEARQSEKAAAEALVSEAEKLIDAAAEARLQAQANLLIVDYDQKVQAMLDAFVAQRAAVNACSNKGTFSGRGVEVPAVQVGSQERIVHGLTLSDYNVRRLPEYLIARILKTAVSEPNLEVLAKDPWSIPEGAEPSDSAPQDALEGADETV